MSVTRPRFVVLDSWRGVCALLVSAHHFFMFTVNNHEHHIISSFFLFVDFFFVLSGFVIANRYGNDISSTRDYFVFIMKRIARTWPLHVFVMLCFALLISYLIMSGEESPYTVGASHTTYDIRKFPLVIFLTNSLGIYSGGWNLPSWSISAEFVAYVVFGLAFLLSSRITVVVSITAAAAIFVFLNGDGFINKTANFGAIRCLMGFGVGVITYRIYSISHIFMPSAKHLSCCIYTCMELISLSMMVVFMILATTLDHNANQLSMLIPVVFGVVILTFTPEGGLVSRILKLQYPVRLGEISYSVYMVHWIVFLTMAHIAKSIYPESYAIRSMWGSNRLLWDLSDDFLFVSMLALFIAIVIAISLLTFRFIENPFRIVGGRYAEKIGTIIGQARKRR